MAEAADHCRKAALYDPDYAAAWITLAGIAGMLGRYEEAEKSARRALELEPHSSSSQANLVNALRSQAKLDDPAAGYADSTAIFVTGIPRSGTSLIAGCLQACGAWAGKTIPGNEDNPEGYFENYGLREGVLKPMLIRAGADPLGVRGLSSAISPEPDPGLRLQVFKHLLQQGYEGGRQPWLYKDCKLTLVWPVWQAAFPNARWIIGRRPREEIILSCLRTNFMNPHSSDSAFWRAWIAEYENRLVALQQSGVWWREIDSHEAVTERPDSIKALVQDLGLQWNKEGIREFIKPKHWHAASTSSVAYGGLMDSATDDSVKVSKLQQRILLNSVAKAGTYLITRTVELLGVEPHPFVLHGALTKRTLAVDETEDSVIVGVDWPCQIKTEALYSILSDMNRGSFMKGHLPYSPRVQGLLEGLDYIMIIIVRDPRDVAVSHVRWAMSRDYLPYQKYYQDLSPSERLSRAISGFAVEPDGPMVMSLRKRFEYITQWRSHQMAYLTSFERLVGPKGGGDKMAQSEEVQNIADHLGIALSAEQNRFVSDNLFGNTMTFKEGKAGGWRDHFSKEHKCQIKDLMGDLIIELGYEKDNSW